MLFIQFVLTVYKLMWENVSGSLYQSIKNAGYQKKYDQMMDN